MVYLNKQQRDALQKELKSMSFGRAKSRLHRIDSQGRLAVYRNNQSVGQWVTRFDLRGLGTRVMLVEAYDTRTQGGKHKAKFELVDVIVEPLPDNKT